MTNTSSYLINGLREYADWLEAHPECIHNQGMVQTYCGTVDSARKIMAADEDAEVQATTSDQICYLNQKFSGLKVVHTLDKSDLMEPSINGGKVIWVFKPEFRAVSA